jgi:hypothetical protein
MKLFHREQFTATCKRFFSILSQNHLGIKFTLIILSLSFHPFFVVRNENEGFKDAEKSSRDVFASINFHYANFLILLLLAFG